MKSQPFLRRAIAAVALTAAAIACSDAGSPPATIGLEAPPVDPSEQFPGGDATVDRDDEKAFSQSAPGLGFRDEATFKTGNLLFRNTPAGLGPLFNTQSCQGCHNQDGRGSPPRSADDPMVSMLLKLAIPDPADAARLTVDPIYGDQLQTFGTDDDGPSEGLPRHDGALPRDGAPFGDGAIGEGFGFIEYAEITGAYPDGAPWSLRQPTYRIRDLSYGPLGVGVLYSPRIAQTMIGLGLLEAIPEEDLLARADPDDRDRDGISGRPNSAWDVLGARMTVGRMGLKAGQPSVLQQAAAAYRGDIGITSSLFATGPCTEQQAACLESEASRPGAGPDVELADLQLAMVEFYARHLGVPRRRGWDGVADDFTPEVGRGRALFYESGCATCHTPQHVTGTAAGSVLGDVNILDLIQPARPLEQLSGQVIWPYTDLLLHDMGGECEPTARESADGSACESGPDCVLVRRCSGLADGFPEGGASGSEWRTPPLWGLGLVQVVNPLAGFLHDGRARTIEEAILWHGGEASTARRRFTELDASDRRALLAFLETQ